MKVHIIMCTYLGDGELDVGKTARWVQWFGDSIFFYDANGTDNRKYAIDYAKTWPDCKFAYHPGSAAAYSKQPEVMRQMAFQAASTAWAYDDNDWVIYVDGTEGISVDVPQDALELLDDPGSTRFRYLYDEVQAATNPYLDVPIRIFLQQGTVVEHDFPIDPTLGNVDYNIAKWWSNNPHYLGTTTARWGILRRLFKVSYLKGTPNWTLLDAYKPWVNDTGLTEHTVIVSYSYARYSEVDYYDPTKWVEENDEGFATRLFMQQVPGRNIPALPINYATPDPVGSNVPIPPGPARILVTQDPTNAQSFTFTGHVTNESGDETYTWQWGDATANGTGQTVVHIFPGAGPYTVTLTVHDPAVTTDRTATCTITPSAIDAIDIPPLGPAPTPAFLRALSPPYCYYVSKARDQYVMLFVALWRLNPRDGVWWDQMVIGPAPIDPLTGQPDIGTDPTTGQAYDPSQWDNQQPQARVVITRPDQVGPGV